MKKSMKITLKEGKFYVRFTRREAQRKFDLIQLFSRCDEVEFPTP